MASETMDDMLVQLMSMGFELPDCQDAIQYGKVTVQEAVEWLIAGKPGMPKTEASQPTLKLNSSTQSDDLSASSNPFVNPVMVQRVPTGHASAAPTSEDSDESLVSRMHLNNEQKKVKLKFEERVRDEAQREAREEKLKAKKEKARILLQIAEDRDKVKLMRGHASGSDTNVDSMSPSKKMSVELAPTPSQSSTGDKCMLQIRLANGQSLRQSFHPSDTLNTVWDFVYRKYNNITDMAFIQPFPRREFTKEEHALSLTELGLTPTGSLVMQNRSAQGQQSVSGQPSETAGFVSKDGSYPGEASGDDNNDDEDEGNDDMMMPDVVRRDPSYRWGRGQRMNDEGEEERAGGPRLFDDPAMDEGEDDDAEGNIMANIMGNNFPNMPGRNMGMGGYRGARQQAFAGQGQVLVPDYRPRDDREHHNKPAGQLAAEAARHRFVQPDDAQLDPVEECHGVVSHDVPCLLHLCLGRVSRRLTDPRHPLKSLGGVTEELAQKLLAHLMKERSLKPKCLQVFVPCYLRRLILDSYPYATNDLLHSVRYHVNLVHLSLHSCTLFTDNGLKPLAGLKKLRVLNLGSCQQLSNKCFSILSEFSSLHTLNLENTVISDAGLLEYLANCSQNLMHLNLNRTPITHAIIPHLKVLSKLKSLYLEQTKVCSLSGIQVLTELEVLDVADTDIVTDSLLCLSGHPALSCLSVANTESVIGDQALQYLSGLKLHTLYLPSRHTTTNQGLMYLTGLPLTSLDLMNYINVGDEGMMHVGKIITLKKLLLSNTKVSDQGMQYLRELTNLEALYLDRTLVSDVGASCIKAFTKLEELSLSSTCVTSQFLCSKTLNSCHLLSKLNLSRTSVSDKGVQQLHLQSLTLLNLDMTHVHPGVIATVYQNNPSLRSVTAANLNPIIEEEENMEV